MLPRKKLLGAIIPSVIFKSLTALLSPGHTLIFVVHPLYDTYIPGTTL